MDLLKRALIRALAINQADACGALYSNRTVKKTLGLVDVSALSLKRAILDVNERLYCVSLGRRVCLCRRSEFASSPSGPCLFL